MKKYLKLYILLLVALTTAMSVSATEIWEDPNYYSAYSMGPGKVHVKVPARFQRNSNGHFQGGAWGDKTGQGYTANQLDPFKGESYFYYRIIQKDGSKGDKVPFAYIASFDWADKDKGKSEAAVEAGDGWVVVTKDFAGQGHLAATNCFLSKTYVTLTYHINTGNSAEAKVDANGFTQHAVKYTNADMVYFEGDWEMPALPDSVQIEVGISQSIYAHSNINWVYKQTSEYDRTLGRFTTTQDAAPTLADAFFYPMDQTGSTLVGKVGIVYSSGQKPVSYTPYLDNVAGTTVTTSNYGGVVTANMADREQQFRMEFVTYVKQSETVTQTQVSNTITIKPYHALHHFKAEPYAADGVDKGYNRISWELYHMKQEDLVNNDMIVVTRATRPDFSDEKTLPYMYTIKQQEQDTVLCEYVDSLCTIALGEGQKYYYRAYRASAAVWNGSPLATQAGYQACDSVAVHACQWSLYDGTDHATLQVQYTPEQGAIVYVNLCEAYDEQLKPINYQWDKRAILTLSRYNETTGEERTFNLTSDKRAVLSPCTKTAQNPQGGWAYKFRETDLRPCCTYHYSVSLDTAGCVLRTRGNAKLAAVQSGSFHVDDVPPTIHSFNAEKGVNKNFVLLNWDIDEQAMDSFVIHRKMVSASETGAVRIGATQSLYYHDSSAAPGMEYEYTLTGYYSCDGEVKTITCTPATGCLNPYASISGYVQMPNGTGLPGVSVTIESKDKSLSRTVETDATGAFYCDSLPYTANGTQYKITPAYVGLIFHLSGTAEQSIDVTFAPHAAEKTGYIFVTTNSYTITGRVLYHKTSVPVAYAEFDIQYGTMQAPVHRLANASGAPVRTDLNGEFSIVVPANVRSLRVRKEHHTFLNDGYLEVETGRRELNLTEGIAECRFYDTTKAHVLGRVAGGTKEGGYALGNDLSTNVLGDSITLVLELEGDKVSWLVNDPNDLSLTERDTVVTHVRADGAHATTIHKTRAHTTRKRVSIYPDNTSGEWQLDLLPVRYKIVQMTAQGYSSLLSADEAMPVLDLTDYADSTALYNYIYRSQPVLTYNQQFYGMDRNYFGVETVEMYNLDNTYTKVQSAYVDSLGRKQYMFGFPLYSPGTYQMKVQAYEPYYYNNDSTSVRKELVPLTGTVQISNGMNSNTDTLQCVLNEQGEGTFTYTVNNTTFSRTGSNALRTLDMWLPYRGAYIEARPLRAYVMGTKEVPGAVMTKLGSTLTLHNILRDPYGAGSYAYMSKGTSFQAKYSYTYDINWGVTLKVSGGVSYKNYAGVAMGAVALFGSDVTISLPSITLKVSGSTHEAYSYIYNFSTDEEIKTSSSAEMFGADADIYIGAVTDVGYVRRLAIQMLDSTSYQMLLPEFTAGTAHLMCSGRDADGGLYYLAVLEANQPAFTYPATFSYTQSYIRCTLIPDLKRQRNTLLKDMSFPLDSARTLANQQHKNYYISRVPADDPKLGSDTAYYTVVEPDNTTIKDMLANEVNLYNQLIEQWEGLIMANEAVKISAMRAGSPTKTYDVSGGTQRSYSETASYSESRTHRSNVSVLFDVGFGGNRKGVNDTKMQAVTDSAMANQAVKVKLPGINFSLDLSTTVPTPIKQSDNQETNAQSRKVGFVIAPGGGNSTSQSVYRVTNADWNKASEYVRDNAFDLHQKESSMSWHGPDDKDVLAADFVFVQNGGVTCCPWEPADSTLYLKPKMPLGTATQKLANPKLSLNIHEQSNIPADEAALFTLTISNESEVASGKLFNFTLYVEDATNPNGLEVLIDGLPVGTGRTFCLGAGQTITKVMQVRRGVGYDFENIQLGLMNECESGMASSKRQKDFETFSVHYRPVASPVSISAPDNKWVLNTLSSSDEDGYYLPVTISGYDVNYDGFDHIELQYKLSTEGDKQWVNLCSFYADANRMAEATGRCQLINSSGKIEGYRFYGERDPIEQQYDLRAVSYSRYGNGYITRESALVSGTKDTRIPTQFGKATPTNGILTFEDDILINFSEPIAGQYLDKDNNFQVLGSTNAISIETGTSLSFPGTETATAISRTTRSLLSSPFTIDMMVKAVEDNKDGTLFAIHTPGSEVSQISFAVKQDTTPFGTLEGCIANCVFYSHPLQGSLKQFSRLQMVYDTIGGGQVTFYQDMVRLGVARADTLFSGLVYDMKGNIELGPNYRGHMMEVRLWKKALSASERSQTHMVRLTGYEPSLLAYYPLNEGRGTVAQDLATGNHIDLHGTSWQMPEGHSMRLTAETAAQDIRPQLSEKLVTMNDASDYTMMLWWRAEDHTTLVGDTMTLFSTGNGRTGGLFVGLEDGVLTVRGGDRVLRSATTTVDENWHHLTMTVNRNENLVNVYADENLVAQGHAAGFPGISGLPYLGYCANTELDTLTGALKENNHYWFRGHIDYFSLWHSALPLDFISLYANNAPTGEEIALQAYLQFHRKHLNNNGIYEVIPSVCNEVCKRDPETGLIAVRANENRDTLLCIDAAAVNAIWDKSNFAPVQESQKMTKLNYRYKTKDDQLLIELTNMEKTINKQRVYIAVRAVEDLNGNPLASTITVPVYVDLNRIRWSEYSREVEVLQGESADIEVKILNRCGSIKQFEISTDDRWLSSETTSGQMHPKEERTIRLHVSDGLNPGTYSTFVYVTDESGLWEPMLITVDVQAPEPDWNPEMQDASVTASLMAQVRIPNGTNGYVLDMDPRDIVSAFAGSRCLGKANLTVTNTGRSEVYMTLYGAGTTTGSSISFYLWQASTGRIYPLRDMDHADRVYAFSENACFGCAEPLTLQALASDNIQMINLNAGWNWISTYLYIDPNRSNVNSTILTRSIFSAGDQIKTTADGGQFVEYGQNAWLTDTKTLTHLSHSNVYQIRCAKGGKMELVGDCLPDSLRQVKAGMYRWAQLPYLCETTHTVTDALTGYHDYAKVGDIVKSYDRFAVYSTEGWRGSLEYMRPGEGYFLYSQNPGQVTIRFVNLDNTDRAPARAAEQQSENATSAATHAYTSTAMPIVAEVVGLETEPGDEIRVYSDDRLVGTGRASEGRFYLMTHATDGNTLDFEICRVGAVVGHASTTITYRADASYGTYEMPLPLEFNGQNGGTYKVLIDNRVYIVRDGHWYHIDGTAVTPLR